MSIIVKPGNYPHTFWIDLKQNGVLIECIILKKDQLGNMSFIETNKLDKIDKNRLVKILNNRNAKSFELWDLMSQITLKNGVNALTYFHQLVQVITPQGVIMSPRTGEIGIGSGIVDTNVKTQNNNVPVESNTTAPAVSKKTRTYSKKKTESSSDK